MQHRRIIRFTHVAAAVAASSLLVASCGAGSSDDEGGSIKVGVVLSLSGPAAPFGIPERDAAEAYIDDVNDQGGIDGRKIELIVEDDKTNPTEAASAAQSLVDEGVVAIIGSTTGSATQAMSAVTTAAEVPILGLNTAVGISGPYTFLATVGDEEMIPAIFDRMVAEGHTRIAVFHQEDALGQYGAELFEELAAENRDVEIVATASAPLDATDVSAQASRLRNADPDAVFVAVSATGLASGFLRAADSIGLDVPGFGGMSLAQDAILEAAGPAAEGFTVANIIDSAAVLENQTGLYELLEAAGIEPVGGFPELGGAGAASMVVAALREAGPSADGNAIVEAWESGIEMETFTKTPGTFGPERRNAHTADVLVWTHAVDGEFVGVE
ncbi:ABC transporter substrate-binding protein [Aeromicrobium sp. Leaf350]|uniref:ABC transporter substrate-binding protein n=1 Tax=Aeromicrobium sp. Leaf350 TaxID=2876565 RepID=UPI001E4FAAB2|nr:ABC transporter substrate-binding protein [Aeromicrobium sp. Leaf350]